MKRVASALGIERGGRAARLHRDAGDPLVHHFDADAVCGAAQDALDFGFVGFARNRPRPVDRNVAGRLRPDLVSAGRERSLGV